jgi:hypothetical protein
MIKIYENIIQGTEEWYAIRCGLLTASEMKKIVTPTFKAASNDKERDHLYELLAQRVTKYVEPSYISDDMTRGQEDENQALTLYHDNIAPSKCVGFITNDKWGFTLGYSPDALVGEDGLIEVKSRRQKFQVQTFAKNVIEGTIPDEFMIQIQTGLLVSERKWCDFISYSGGLPMAVIRVFPDLEKQEALIESARSFEARLSEAHEKYLEAIEKTNPIPTYRRVEQEIFL